MFGESIFDCFMEIFGIRKKISNKEKKNQEVLKLQTKQLHFS